MELIKGQESLLYIKKGSVYVPVACLTSNNISESSESIQTTTRENAGWKTSLPTIQAYQISIDGFMVKDDIDSGNNLISYRELRTLKRDKVQIQWKIETIGGWYIDYGQGYIMSISESNSTEDMIGFSATLEGFGKPQEDTNKQYVLGDTDESLIIYTNNLIPTK